MTNPDRLAHIPTSDLAYVRRSDVGQRDYRVTLEIPRACDVPSSAGIVTVDGTETRVSAMWARDLRVALSHMWDNAMDVNADGQYTLAILIHHAGNR